MSMRGPSRRALAGAILAPTAAAARSGAVGEPKLAHRFDLTVKVAPAQELGDFAGGRRRVIPIIGGELTGPNLRGEVLPGGADWQTLGADGVTRLEARYTIRMKDGATVGVVNAGVRRAPTDVVRRLTAGEVVDPALVYFRTTPVFEVGPGPYRWLTESVFIGLGERMPDLVRIKVFELA